MPLWPQGSGSVRRARPGPPKPHRPRAPPRATPAAAGRSDARGGPRATPAPPTRAGFTGAGFEEPGFDTLDTSTLAAVGVGRLRRGERAELPAGPRGPR